MKVLVVHNFYRQAGGEDEVFFAETRALEDQGVTVTRYSVHNDDLQEGQPFSAATRTIWNPASARAIAGLVRQQASDVVHFHNTFPIISPAGYYAARSAGARVVQTLHNYKLLCPASTLYRDGQPCEDCVGKAVPWPAVQHACYRESRAASGVLAATLGLHRLLHTYDRMIDRYIALSESARRIHIRGGLKPEKLVVKPNFLASDPGPGAHQGDYALFVGRLTQEKGVPTLLDAWAHIGTRLPLRIAGAGPLAELVERRAGDVAGIEYLGRQSREQVAALMQGARLLVFPSEWYEGFPMTLIEAFAAGLPVVASRIGSVAEVVEDGVTGRHFRPRDPADLAAQVRWLLDHPQATAVMGEQARLTYLRAYTAPHNARHLIGIYQEALGLTPAPHPGEQVQA